MESRGGRWDLPVLLVSLGRAMSFRARDEGACPLAEELEALSAPRRAATMGLSLSCTGVSSLEVGVAVSAGSATGSTSAMGLPAASWASLTLVLDPQTDLGLTAALPPGLPLGPPVRHTLCHWGRRIFLDPRIQYNEVRCLDRLRILIGAPRLGSAGKRGGLGFHL